jgi:predicted Zn-dependent protease
MKRWVGLFGVLICTGVLCQSAVAQRQTSSPVSQALEQEMKRAMDVLGKNGDPVPYFMSYEVNEITETGISASRGALRSDTVERGRYLDLDVRVGNYTLDNTHEIRGQRGGGGPNNSPGYITMPVDDDMDALRSVIWLQTDRRYKQAAERLIQVKANRAVKVEEEDSSADFSREKVETEKLPLVSTNVDKAQWEKKMKAYSALLSKNPEILEGTAEFTATATNQYFVDSEGTSTQQGMLRARIMLYARTKADDGMELYRSEYWDAHTVAGLPSDAVIQQNIDKMLKDLKALRAAPVVEPFTGPAILSGRASGVFFHEIFGHRMEGQRNRSESEGQTFTKQVNKPILPDFLSVTDDPTAEKIAGIDLNGYYHFDDEGVRARPVPVVENGVLRNFLLGRTPVAGFEQSNGHGRKDVGYRAVSRQGNLIVQASRTVTNPKLREMLIDEAKKQGKPFGLFFEDISGGFTSTDRQSPQAFQVTPIMVYRVYVDGRPDELVRGVDLIGTPLTSFSKITAASDKLEVFNGFCGAESGYVPVSAVSPSILTSQIEVQKKAKSSERMPILPPPSAVGGGN